jgi:RNA:NAD 2'-phosphotransferase (TPT1/KptA family)
MTTGNKALNAPIYHVTEVRNRAAILREGLKAKAGSWHKVTWKPRVFFTITQIGAYEIANNFMHERRGEYLFILVDPAKMRGKLRPDRDYDQGVWTSTDVPPEAIIGVESVDAAFFESGEFLAYMGIEDDDHEEEVSP